MSTLSVAQVSRAGVTGALQAADSYGDEFLNDRDGSRTFLEVENLSTASVVVTVTTPDTVNTPALAVADLAVTVAAMQRMVIGPFPASIYNGADRYVFLTVSDETDVYVGAFYLGD